MKFLVFLTFVFLLQLNRTSAEQKCNNQGYRKFDSDVAKLIGLGESGRKFPESKQEHKGFCNQSYHYTFEIEAFKTRCLKNLPRQLTGILIYAVKNDLKQNCRKETRKNINIIDSSPCTNAARSEFNKCYTNYIEALQGAKYAVETKRIPHLCCSTYKFYPCLEEKAPRFRECSPRRIEIISSYIRSLFDNMLDFTCGDYTENSDKCEKLEPPPKKKRRDIKAKSMAIPLIELLDSFPEI